MTKRPPRVGFVSLGCPKALVDSERIVTELRAEGYLISSTYKDSDLVIVNTCGFIDAAVQESLEAISEALSENGKVIVTGCLGGKNTEEGNFVALRFPKLLGVTGPEQTEEVLRLVHDNLPRPHEPFGDLVPAGGVLLTPKTLCLSQDCRGLQPSLHVLHYSFAERSAGIPSDRFRRS